MAQTLKANPQIRRVEIAGHTDDRGNDDDNLILSQDRAAAVKTYLVEKGVDADRLRAKGYGESEPITKKKSKRARAKNRRVEFKILEQ